MKMEFAYQRANNFPTLTPHRFLFHLIFFIKEQKEWKRK